MTAFYNMTIKFSRTKILAYTFAASRFRAEIFGFITLCGLLIIPSQCRAAKPADTRSVVNRTAAAVCSKQMVILGELPSHGEAQTFQFKAQIVRQLINRCGFNTVLFEAPIYDFLGVESAAAEKSATPAQLDQAIGRFWLNRELADWRGWLFRQAATRKITLGGLDDQISVTSADARRVLPALVVASLSQPDASECGQVVERNLNWRYDAGHPFDETEQSRLQRCARGAFDAASVKPGRHDNTFEQVMLENFANYVDRQQKVPAGRDRDEEMFRNVLWYSKRLPARRKIIIWTATVHAARRQIKPAQLPLGVRLADRWSNRLAVIGFTAYTGESSMAGHPAKLLPEAPPDSLEARATDGNKDLVLLDSPSLRRFGAISSRLMGDFTTSDWSKSFDLVLVIRRETAPAFEQQK